MTAAARPATRSPRGRSRSRGWLTALLFLAPFLAVYLVLLVYPLFLGIWISFRDWDLMAGDYGPVGLLNYQDLWTDPVFWRSTRNTLYFALLTVPSMTIIAMLLALAVQGPGRIRAICRSVFFLSSVFSVTVVTLVWQMVLAPDRGLIAPIVQFLGFTPVNYLGSTTWAMPAIVVTTLWWGVGLPMALFLAALGSIPKELYEAAELDHASRWSVFWRITLPSIRHTVILVIVLQIVAQFQIFGQPFLMTQGGPANSTRSLVQYIYETSFRDWLVGYGAAMAMVLFGMMLVFSMLQLWLGRQGDDR
ncbi:carbohydrate ABC transporter permease [Rubellimicrobium arenae]|uniref:carbohydrate ABC transporter permease n=1 Tax=Rubellimicrobium arenae TaxID=2817372 RepID=UPI001B316CA1|nr:sugar ABC transporter permease [Rubellimicrobium arenae]